jgi:uncharacterized protein DUF4232
MDPLEDDLRRLLTADRWSLTPGSDAAAHVRHGVRRRRRNRAIAMSTSAVVVVAGGAAIGLALARDNGGRTSLQPSTSGPPASAVDFARGHHAVTWKNIPATIDASPTTAYTIPTTSTTAPTCGTSGLRGALMSEAAAGSVYGTLVVQNTGQNSCSVSGTPTVELLDDSGTVIQSTAPSSGGSATPVVLLPDSWAGAPLGRIASNVCGGLASTQVRYSLANSSTTSTFDQKVGGPLTPDCSGSARPPATAPGDLTAQPFATLPESQAFGDAGSDWKIALKAVPVTMNRNSYVNYVVTFTSKSGTPLFTNGCPVYEQRLPYNFSEPTRLDCSAVPQSATHARFAMRAHLSDIPDIGSGLLQWILLEPRQLTLQHRVAVPAR